jgi:MFS family permease
MAKVDSSPTGRRNIRLLLIARGMRAFGDGVVSILMPVYLTPLGISVFQIGAITTAMLLGPAVMTLAMGLIAHRLRIDRLLADAVLLIVLSGIGYAYATEFWPVAFCLQARDLKGEGPIDALSARLLERGSDRLPY